MHNQTSKAIPNSHLVLRKFISHRLALLALLILLCLCLLSLGAPLIEHMLKVSHLKADLAKINLPAQYPHLLGTNELGQDVFTRLLYGGRVSLSVGLLAALASSLLGALIGLFSGYFGGFIDASLMRFTDAMLAIPILPLMIVFQALDLSLLFIINIDWQFMLYSILLLCGIYMLSYFLYGDRKRNILYVINNGLLVAMVMLAFYIVIFKLILSPQSSDHLVSVSKMIVIIVFFGWMIVARLTRASVLQLKNIDFVHAAIGLGASHYRVLYHHILPNILSPIIVATTLEIGANILYEASLSFLGLGIKPPISSWGNMLNNAVEYIKSSPHLAFWPGVFILITVACFNCLGDGMRDALDPYQVKNRVGKK